jgi:hypothetical protein
MDRHPRFEDLAAFAEGGLPPRDQASLKDHLAGCESCRETLAYLQDLGRASRGLRRQEVPLPPDLWERVLTRRQSGTRRILPLRPVGPGTGRRRRNPFAGRRIAGWAAAIAAITTASLLLGRAPGEAGAAWSELRLSPSAPAPGDRIEVRYEGGHFHGHDSIRVRAALVGGGTARELPTQETMTELILHRNSAGWFQGTLTLPGAVDYAMFAVEDATGSFVDHNGGRLWDVMVHSEDGHPRLGALDARREALRERDWSAALKTAEAATRLYPEDPESWSQLSALQAWLGPGSARPEERVSHAERFQELHIRFQGPTTLSERRLAGMASYAIQAGAERPIIEYWTGRLRENFPHHPRSLLSRQGELQAQGSTDVGSAGSESYFAALDRLWLEVDSSNAGRFDDIIENAIREAVDRSRPDMVLRWSERAHSYLGRAPDGLESLVRPMLGWPETRRVAIKWLEEGIARFQESPERDRPLWMSRAEHRQTLRNDLGRLHTLLGLAFLADGDEAGAARALAQAVSKTWSPEAFLSLAGLRIARGDTTGSWEMLARLEADPTTEVGSGSALASLHREAMAHAEWELWVEQARGELARHMLSRAHGVRVDLTSRLRGPGGAEQTLESLLGRDGAVLIYCDRLCDMALARLLSLEGVARSAREGRLTIIAVSMPGDSRFAMAGSRPDSDSIPLYEDSRGELRNALGAWAFPRYHIVNQDGWIPFGRQGLTVEDLPRGELALEVRDPVGHLLRIEGPR